MKRLWSYMKHYKKESILGPLFKLLEASFELLVPLVVANIIDTGIASRDGSYVLKMGGVLILLGFVGLASSITAQYFAAKAAVGTSTAMRKALFEHLNSFSYKELDTIGTSTLITRITSDINQVQTGVNLVLRLFLRSPFIVFGAMIMAFTIDVKVRDDLCRSDSGSFCGGFRYHGRYDSLVPEGAECSWIGCFCMCGKICPVSVWYGHSTGSRRR